jgi:hypothetical protein
VIFQPLRLIRYRSCAADLWFQYPVLSPSIVHDLYVIGRVSVLRILASGASASDCQWSACAISTRPLGA